MLLTLLKLPRTEHINHTIMQLSVITIVCLLVLGPAVVSSNNVTDSIKKVHIVFMNHLDVGFDGILPTPGLIGNIINRYFGVYFPRAVEVGFQLELLGFQEQLVYTTHPWLVSLYMNCPPDFVLSGIKIMCPNETSVSGFKAAVQAGFISWHAGDMNNMFETMDASLVEFGLQLSQDLDSMFNIKRTHRTLSQRDVPGMTKSLIPLFVKHGIEAVSVGVNGATAPPEVPPIFLWKFQNSSVIAMWHPRGYPDDPGSVPAMPGGLSWKDCVTFPGLDEALCWAFRTDNSGPPETYTEVLSNFEVVRAQFPNAKIVGSTFEAFTAAAMKVRDQLPVVTSEIGDTWIQGAASDPRKVAQMREFFRARTACLQSGKCSLSNPRFYNSSRFLAKVGEHTWGLDSLFDTVNYTNEKFYKLKAKNPTNVQHVELSWKEQRQFMDLALDALGSEDPLVKEVLDRWAKLDASKPSLEGFHKVVSEFSSISCGDMGYSMGFGEDGSLIKFKEPHTGRNWASDTNPLGQFIYQTYNQSDFDRFHVEYETGKFFLGIGKPNMTNNTNAESKIWPMQMVELYQSDGKDCRFLVHIQPQDSRPMTYYGAPGDIWVSYTVDESASGPALLAELQWFDKMPTRLPEALFFSFQPVLQPDFSWQMSKLDQWLDPLDVVVNGSQRLHSLDPDRGMLYTNAMSSGLGFASLDAPLANLLTPQDSVSTLPLPLKPLKQISGVAFNLFNNIWEVNFIFWYPFLKEDADQKFRFQINIRPEK